MAQAGEKEGEGPGRARMVRVLRSGFGMPLWVLEYHIEAVPGTTTVSSSSTAATHCFLLSFPPHRPSRSWSAGLWAAAAITAVR